MSKTKSVEHGLPKRIFTRWEENGTEHFVGVYELKEVYAVKTITSTRIVSKAVKP